MKRMFQTEMQEKRDGIININNFDIEDVNQLIGYMYTGKVEEGFSRYEVLLQLANQYEVLDLVLFCANKMSRNLSPENALEYGILGDMHNSDVLIKSSAKYIHANVNMRERLHQEDWMQKMKTSPNLMSEIMKLMADAEAIKNIENEKR